MSDEANEFLQGGGAPPVKFPTIGTSVSGIVQSSKVQQQNDIDGKPKFYDDGNPMKQLVITMLTEEHDSTIPNDDGSRRLFVKGALKFAVTDALRKADAELNPGGHLTVTFTSEIPSTKRGYNNAKQYEAVYVAGAVVPAKSSTQEFLDEEPF